VPPAQPARATCLNSVLRQSSVRDAATRGHYHAYSNTPVTECLLVLVFYVLNLPVLELCDCSWTRTAQLEATKGQV
jgi:hypothetical protein